MQCPSLSNLCHNVEHVGHIVEHLEITAKAAKENIVIQLDSAKSADETHTYLEEEIKKNRKLH